MSIRSQMIASLALACLVAMMANQGADAQGFFQRPSIFNFQAAQMVRFANTACRGDNNESGTCLSPSECERKGGTSSGACANGAGSCCSFKVSI